VVLEDYLNKCKKEEGQVSTNTKPLDVYHLSKVGVLKGKLSDK
jgi:hypothetical protein